MPETEGKITEEERDRLLDSSVPIARIQVLMTEKGPMITGQDSILMELLCAELQAVIHDAIEVGIRAISEVIAQSPMGAGIYSTTQTVEEAEANFFDSSEARTINVD